MQRGITLIEVLVSLALGSIVIVALMRFVSFGFPVSRMVYFQAQANEIVRVQLQRISQALREVRFSDTGGYPLVVAEPQRIIFYSDVDDNGVTERIRYELTGTKLTRGVIIPSGTPLTYNPAQEKSVVVASYVRNGAQPLFTYYGGDYPDDPAPLNPVDLTQVKYVHFSLMVDVDPALNPPAVVVQSDVQLRNLKTNLAE